jgi:hypothetical protein
VLDARFQPSRSRSRAGTSGWPRRGGWREGPARAGRGTGGSATESELAVVAAVVVARSEKGTAHRLGLSHSTVRLTPNVRASHWPRRPALECY